MVILRIHDLDDFACGPTVKDRGLSSRGVVVLCSFSELDGGEKKERRLFAGVSHYLLER